MTDDDDNPDTDNDNPDPWENKSAPPEWGLADVVAIDTEVGIYACVDENDATGGQTLVWHWCTKLNRYMAAGTSAHQLVSRDPLHIEPSLLWNCCGQHGWIREGRWVQA